LFAFSLLSLSLIDLQLSEAVALFSSAAPAGDHGAETENGPKYQTLCHGGAVFKQSIYR